MDIFSKSFFDKWIKEASPEILNWHKKENEFLKKIIKKNSAVLDIGCGFGRHIKILAEFCRKVFGVDNNKTMLEKAKENLAGINNTEVYLENAQKLHFDNNFFDYIVCMTNTFGTFLENKTRILKEIKRVLKKNGKIIISVYSEKATDIRIESYKRVGIHIEKVKNGKVYFKDGHITEEFSKEQLKEIFNSVGLKSKIIELTPISYMCVVTKS